MLEVAEKRESVEETALRFGCKCLPGLVVSQVCTYRVKGNCNVQAPKKKKVR